MKTNLLFICALLILSQSLKSQVTKLSNNTSLSGAVVGNKVILISDVNNTLWTTDGTAAGTVQYAMNVVLDSAQNGVVFNNKIYFTGVEANYGAELWVTDGTAGGTILVKDIVAGKDNSAPSDFIVFNSQVFFYATTAATGYELWKTDGTAAGTQLVKDINPGVATSKPDNPGFFISNNQLIFYADDGVHGFELWKTDGTTAGTQLVKDINPGTAGSASSTTVPDFAALGNIALFYANDGSNGAQLWKTDGTEAGTQLIKNINPAGNAGSNSLFNSLIFKNKLYFDAADATTGSELWMTDGTTAGTQQVKDINPGIIGSNPFLFDAIIFGDKFLFTAFTTAEGFELWSSDGTQNGTALFKDFITGPESSTPILMPDFNSNFANSHTQLFNGSIFFNLANTTGAELWITDGTLAGTKLVKAVNSNANDRITDYFYTTTGIFFSQFPTSGDQLWQSDGSATGTQLIKIINPATNPGNASSSIIFQFVYNNQLYFGGDDGDNTTGLLDLYKIDATVSPLPVNLFNFTAVLQTKSVQLNWSTATEINSSYFNVERSKDGTRFESLGQVNAGGVSVDVQKYRYDDNKAYSAGVSTLYYRLQMVDKDGSFKYSAILPVRLKDALFEISLMPNPARQQLNVNFAVNGAQKILIRIVDMKGNPVYQQNFDAGQASYQQNINIGRMAKGTYYLQLVTEKEKKSLKFIKE